MRKVFILAGICLFLLSAAGCSTSKLERKVDDLERKVTSLEEKSSSLESRVDMSESSTSYSSSSSVKRTGKVTLSSRQIQTALKNAGYYNGAVDGKLGPRSKEAIKAFQRDQGLKIDGIAGQATKRALSGFLAG